MTMTTIATSHVGSLPRGPELTPLLLARDAGEAYDPVAFDTVVQAAVDAAVAAQVEAGVTIVSDGELGKVGYSTYIIERLEGFGGNSPRKPALDLAPLPELRTKLAAIMGAQEFTRASCIAPVVLKTLEPLDDDIRRFRSALDRHGEGTRAFLNAASPGLITAFQPNAYYPTHEAYLAALVDAMRPEYEAIAAAGFELQLDCPDLAMSRHTGYQDMDEAEFLRTIEANVEALNAATAGIAPEAMRMHVCWGNYEGPHDHDIPLERVIDIVLKAKPSTVLFEAANPRHEHEWKVWQDAKLGKDQVLIPGVISHATNVVEHPELVAERIVRLAKIVGRENVIAGTDCGFAQGPFYRRVHPTVMWAKLEALSEGARIASKELW